MIAKPVDADSFPEEYSIHPKSDAVMVGGEAKDLKKWKENFTSKTQQAKTGLCVSSDSSFIITVQVRHYI